MRDDRQVWGDGDGVSIHPTVMTPNKFLPGPAGESQQCTGAALKKRRSFLFQDMGHDDPLGALRE